MPTVYPVADLPRFAPSYTRSVAQAPADVAPQPGDGNKTEKAEKAEKGFSFGDFLSAINPLQHIPIVGTIYRAITGETISPAVRVLGGALLGGPIGLIASVANAIFEQATGKDIGDHALALFKPDKTPSTDQPTQFATAGQSPARENVATDTPSVAADTAVATQMSPDPAATIVASPALLDTSVAPTSTAAGPSPISPSVNVFPGPGSRTLADYRATAGRRLPVFDSTRSASTGGRNAPIPLHPTQTLAGDQLRPPSRSAVRTDGAVSPARSDKPADAGVEPVSAETNGDWVSAAMLQGLDRYREMKQRQMQYQAPVAQRVDTVL